MTIYAPGTPQEAIDADQRLQAGTSNLTLIQKLHPKLKNLPCIKALPCIKKLTASFNTEEKANGSGAAQSGTPPAPPPRYDSGGITVKTSSGSGAHASSSQVRQYAPSGYTTASYGGGGGMVPAIPPVYPQRPEGNVGKQTGHVCMTYSNVNHEMPHSEYMKMDDQQLHNFHNYGPWMPRFDPWAPAAAPAPAEGSGDAKEEETKPCGICRKPAELHKFEHVGAEWVICFKCAREAFAAEGIRLWLDGKSA